MNNDIAQFIFEYMHERERLYISKRNIVNTYREIEPTMSIRSVQKAMRPFYMILKKLDIIDDFNKRTYRINRERLKKFATISQILAHAFKGLKKE